MAFGAADSRSASLALSPSLPLSLSPSLSSDAQMEDDDCMIDEPEGLNPGPEPLSPTHKRSRSDSEVNAAARAGFGRLFNSRPAATTAARGASGSAPRPPRPAAPRASGSGPQAQPSGSASQPLGDGELSGELEGDEELSHRQEPNTARERYTVSEKAVNGYKAAHPWLDEVIVTQEPGGKVVCKGKCTTCMQHNPGQSKWGKKGSGSIIASSNELKQHERQESHKVAVEKAAKAAGGAGSIKAGMQAANTLATVAKRGAVGILLVCALWLTVETIPGRKLPSLLGLVRSLNAPGMPSAQYNHARYYRSALFALSNVLLTNTIAAIKSSPFYSILVDGSTDISTEDHVLVYVRYFDHHNFIFNTVFLCAVRITKGNADSIFLVIRKVLAVMGFAEKKMIGFCSDGAAVLQGRLNGVAVCGPPQYLVSPVKMLR